MATVRKRELKNGVVYDIQVRITDKGSGKSVVKTTTWKPTENLSPKQEERAANLYAEEFEEQIKNMATSSSSKIVDPNITFEEFGLSVVEKIKPTISLHYYVKFTDVIKFSSNYIGKYKVKDLTPAIIQGFYDLLDNREKHITKINPKPNFRETLKDHGFDYKLLRYEKNVQNCTLAGALKGNSVSMKWAKVLCEITKISFDDLFTKTETHERYAYESNHQIKRIIRTTLAHAKKMRLIKDNFATADFIDFPPRPDSEIKVMDDDEAKRFYQTLLNYDNIRIKTALLIFLFTGFRRAEATGLQWKYINFNNNTITIENTVTVVKGHGKVIKKPKTKKSERCISVGNVLIEALREYKVWWDHEVDCMGDMIPEDCDWLFFQNNGNVINPGTFNLWEDKVMIKAGIQHYTLHSIRHTNITMQLAAGVPLVTVSARAGHARTSTTTDIYGHFFKNSDIMAANMLENVFAESPESMQKGQ